jgi:hypothetical protein
MLMKMSTSSSNADNETDLPAVDERLVAPESGYEIIDGKLVRVPPCDQPHAELHSKVAALLVAHVAKGFSVALDMLTRTSMIDDIAPDASVFPSARHPRTGGRQLEQLAFEIASTESLARTAGKAEKLVGRGVRRVFAIAVEKARVFEWSRELGTWSLLDPASTIDDHALAVPLPVDTLVRAVAADDEVASALLAKRNAVLVAALEESHAEGLAEGRAEAVLRALVKRGLEPSTEQRQRILAERSLATLELWFDRALTCAAVAELFS